MSEKKLLYKKKIIRQLYFAQSLSCAALSLGIKKSLPLTTKILNDLIELGQVLEKGQAPSTGGRRPAMYSLVPGVFNIISVAMDQFVTRIAIMDAQNKMVIKTERFELPLKDNPEALSILTQKINEVVLLTPDAVNRSNFNPS